MTSPAGRNQLYSIIIAIQSEATTDSAETLAESGEDWRLGEIEVDWVDFTREKSTDTTASMRGIMTPGATAGDVGAVEGSSSRRKPTSASGRTIPGAAPQGPSGSRTKSRNTASPEDLSLQPLLAHFPGPNPLDSSVAQGVTQVGRGVVHLFRHPPPAGLISSLDAHPVGESSRAALARSGKDGLGDEWAGERAEGEDGSLIAILAVPAWMRPADFLEFIGGWGTCLEGVRMIREATTPNRSIVLLKFRDPLQASDFLVIFTGRAFSTLDARETCHPIRIHHLVLHRINHISQSHSPRSTKTPSSSCSPIAIPAFPPSIYSSRAKQLGELLTGVPSPGRSELPSCPVCLERLDSTVTGLVTLPCAHTFDCDCLRKWGDSRCPVCRVSHLLLSSSQQQQQHAGPGQAAREEIMRMTKCSMCDSTTHNWICVVCGVVGCGRYEPGKGHARRHWEESGHVLAMELETQRVWDYKGDNYVHRLIQTRTDGKLVELPSASSLVTALSRPLPFSSASRSSATNESHHPRQTSTPSPSTHPGDQGPNGRHDHHTSSESEAGPSSNDVEKMSTIEAITLEYSYLLSSQLEAMRQHYESEAASSRSKLSDIDTYRSQALSAETARKDAEAAKEKAERKALKANEVAREMAKTLEAEKAMSEGLAQRVKKLKEEVEVAESTRRGKEEEVKGLEETVRDLMFTLEAGMRIQEAGGGADAGQGGDLITTTTTGGAPTPAVKGKKKKK